MRRIVGATAGALAIALTLVLLVNWAQGRSPLGAPEPEPSASSPETPEAGSQEPPDPALAEFYQQELSWESCRDDFECASLTVPLNYQRPAGPTIDLKLLRVAAIGDRIGSLVVNPGGPGAPGTDYAAYGGRVFSTPVMEAYDIVGFDARGTGESSPIDCLSDPDLDRYVSSDPTPDTAVEKRAYLKSFADFAQGCQKLSGALTRHISTVEAARDMDVLRAALGEDKLDYLGASYGTKLGATYLELFPTRAGRMVLDGAVDPSLSNRDLALGQAGGFEEQLRSYVQNCLDEAEECFLGDSVDAGVARISSLLAEIDRQPLPAGSDRELATGDAFYGIITPLYSKTSWMALSTGLQEALDGDGGTLLMFADIYASRTESGEFTDNSMEANLSINCLDDSSSIKPKQVAAELPAFEKASPTFGRALAWSLVACSGFEPSRPGLSIDGAGADPVLVIGTTRDPATPYAWAVALAEQLESGVLVTRDGDGHTGYNMGNDCVDSAVETYLVEGDVPEDGLEC